MGTLGTQRFRNLLKLGGMYRIYCFADSLPAARRLLDAGAKILQFRNKRLDDADFLYEARQMLDLVRWYKDAVLIINDRADSAIMLGADGVHLGQEDGDYREVIRRAPDTMMIGVSVDTPAEAIEAERAGAAYVGAGAVFPTPSKSDAVVIGIETLKTIVQSVHIPVVAIGGISSENISEVIRTGAHCCAMISEINQAPDIQNKLNELIALSKPYQFTNAEV